MSKKQPSNDKEEREFYSEMDNKTFAKNCCRLPTMGALFLFLLVVSLGATYYIYRQIKGYSFKPQIASSFLDRNSFLDKLGAQNENPTNLEITLTSSELTAAAQEGLSYKKLLIKNVVIAISENDVALFGTLLKPVSTEIKIEAVPKVENGKILWEVQKITAGKMTLPSFLNSEFAGAFNALMDQNFQELYLNYKITQINLAQDKMTILGQLK